MFIDMLLQGNAEWMLRRDYVYDFIFFHAKVCNHDALGCVLMGGEL